MATKYNHKIPPTVRNAMQGFSGGDCFLISNKRDQSADAGLQGNCHFNAEEYVKQFGGQRLPGWLLYREAALIKRGLWVWIFHSVWKNTDGSIFDVTENPTYAGSQYTTVWLDTLRDVNLIEGLNYNSIVIFDNKEIAQVIGAATGSELSEGTIYWTTKNIDMFLPIQSHSGLYRWLDARFPKNIETFENAYNCRIENGRLKKTSSLPTTISKIAQFDYGISI